MITVLADKHLFELSQFIPQEIDLELYDPEKSSPENADKADALLIRTVTKIDEQTIARLPQSVQFIGTASAGTDHVDTELLAEKNIAFSAASGCNAQSVAEYVATALLIWSEKQSVNLSNLTIGIIGVGNVGTTLSHLLDKLDIAILQYDPPRQAGEPGFTSCTLEEVLQADILTFHTPLAHKGKHPTHHWLDAKKIRRSDARLILNTARGGVVNEQALLEAKKEGHVQDIIIDVWENEPDFNEQLAKQAFIATPHIAGYSIEAKRRASQMIVEALCEHFSIPSTTQTSEKSALGVTFKTPVETLTESLTTLHPIKEYQEQLEKLTGQNTADKKAGFNRLRTEFPLRHEFTHLVVDATILEQFPILSSLGINAK